MTDQATQSQVLHAISFDDMQLGRHVNMQEDEKMSVEASKSLCMLVFIGQRLQTGADMKISSRSVWYR